MLKAGMTTVTFKNFSCEENIEFVKSAGLDGIEWAEYHISQGNTDSARRIGELTRAAGIEVLSYGSNYRPSRHNKNDFKKALDYAIALKTRLLRIWPGDRGSEPVDLSYRKEVTEEIREACSIASGYGIIIAVEYHANNLTDTSESALQLIKDVNCVNFKTYWQQSTLGLSFEQNLARLKAVLPYIANVHVENRRHYLYEVESYWKNYLELIRPVSGDHWLIIEFVKDGTPQNFFSDARVLRRLVDIVECRRSSLA
jgi:Sugar phosphate isomerases/epimerases